jgi:hypothetical protein
VRTGGKKFKGKWIQIIRRTRTQEKTMISEDKRTKRGKNRRFITLEVEDKTED